MTEPLNLPDPQPKTSTNINAPRFALLPSPPVVNGLADNGTQSSTRILSQKSAPAAPTGQRSWQQQQHGGRNTTPNIHFDPLSKHIQDVCERNCIEPSRKPGRIGTNFYACQCCHKEFKLDSEQALLTHVKSKAHHRQFESAYFKQLLYSTKHRSHGNNQNAWLCSHLEEGLKSAKVLTATDIADRYRVFSRLKLIIQRQFPALTLLPYGSLVTQIGDQSSDVNIWVDGKISNEGTAVGGVDAAGQLSSSGVSSQISATAAQQVNESTLVKLARFFSNFEDIKKTQEFEGKYPALVLTYGGVNFRLATDGSYSTTIAHYIREYNTHHPLLVQLSQVVRCLWAKKLKIDRPNHGFLPPHTYSMMCIAFLQQRGLLPVLQIEPVPDTPKKEQEKGLEAEVAETPPGNAESHENNTSDCVIDNSENFENCALVPADSVRDCSYECLATATNAQESSQPHQQAQKLNTSQPYQVQISAEKDRRQMQLYVGVNTYGMRINQKPRSLYSLCQDFFNFYLNDFAIDQHIVRIHEKMTLADTRRLRLDRGWPCKRFSIEDIPKNKTQNIAKTMNSQTTFEFYIERMRDMFFYLQTLGKTRDDPDGLAERNLQEQASSLNREGSAEFTHILEALSQTSISSNGSTTTVKPFQAELLYSTGVPPAPPLVCTECGSEDHEVAQCEKTISGLRRVIFTPRLVEREFENYDHISNLAKKITADYGQDERECRRRQNARADIELFLRSNLAKLSSRGMTPTGNICVNLFGSSANGFGSKTSDLDCCLTVEGFDNALDAGLQTEKGENEVIAIAELMMGKENAERFRHVEAVPDAKVPIVRFEHVATGLEGDLSIYNTLPLRNTKLLYTYSKFDPRVLPLGFLLKQFCKTVEIGDASKGSLSSYAYMMLMIHFLQRERVLPNLQDGNSENNVQFHGWNTFFIQTDEEIECLRSQLEADRGPDTRTLGELWLGFLYYFAFEFKWDGHVVCIRKNRDQLPLLAFDKKWTSKQFCIEDPFELSHNLGTGVSKQMALYIIQAISNAYRHFSMQQVPTPLEPLTLEQIFMRRDKIQAGRRPPTDRLCHGCGHIGHFRNNCPKLLQKEKERKEYEERRRAGGRMRQGGQPRKISTGSGPGGGGSGGHNGMENGIKKNGALRNQQNGRKSPRRDDVTIPHVFPKTNKERFENRKARENAQRPGSANRPPPWRRGDDRASLTELPKEEKRASGSTPATDSKRDGAKEFSGIGGKKSSASKFRAEGKMGGKFGVKVPLLSEPGKPCTTTIQNTWKKSAVSGKSTKPRDRKNRRRNAASATNATTSTTNPDNNNENPNITPTPSGRAKIKLRPGMASKAQSPKVADTSKLQSAGKMNVSRGTKPPARRTNSANTASKQNKLTLQSAVKSSSTQVDQTKNAPSALTSNRPQNDGRLSAPPKLAADFGKKSRPTRKERQRKKATESEKKYAPVKEAIKNSQQNRNAGKRGDVNSAKALSKNGAMVAQT